MIGRPYSFVNPPTAKPHEFYFIVVPDGPLSPRLATLQVGDSVWLGPRANGFFKVRVGDASLSPAQVDAIAARMKAESGIVSFVAATP